MFGGFGNNQNTNFGNTQANPGFGASPFASNTNANTNTTAGYGFGQPGQQQNPTFGSSNFSNLSILKNRSTRLWLNWLQSNCIIF